jgi:prephenate dehydrogenase
VRLALVGVGLIGGSIGLAARHRLGAWVTGFDPAAGALEAALARGAVDVACPALDDALEGADAAFVAAPVGVLPDVVDAVLATAPAGCVVSDVGSTKRAVLAGRADPRFIGGHPLAGAETAGVEHAREALFEGAIWYLVPTAVSAGVHYERLHRLVAGLGARPTAIEADAHDRLLASVSHLPHVLANVLVAQAARVLDDEGEHLPATGPSFRDATRVAGSSSAIWTDIYLSNRDALVERVDDAIARLRAVREDLARADRQRITAWNDAARDDRRRLLEVGLTGGPVHELRASVPNEPGVVARLALELGRAGVNIVDMALHPAPDGSAGVVALFVAGDEPARHALEHVRALGFPVAGA